MKILFYIHHLARGGAERVTTTLANEMAERGHQVYIVHYADPSDAYPISDKIHDVFIPLNVPLTMNRFRAFIPKLKFCLKLRRVIKEIHPDVAIGVLYINYLTLLKATIGLGIPVIASDHNNFHWNENRLKKFTRYYLYRFADAVTILSENDKEFMKSRLPNTRVLYNPLSFPRLTKEEEPRRKSIICVGRLNAWSVKGFDRIIDIWSQIAEKYPDWTLEIAGPGDNKSALYLVDLVKQRDLTGRVFFWGALVHLDEILRTTAIFALPSREEGFPCVLIEAMSQGCASVSFEIHGNIKEIITDGQDGLLVPDGDLDAFRENLETLIQNEELRSRLGKNAIESMKRFEPDLIVDQWLDLFNELTKKK